MNTFIALLLIGFLGLFSHWLKKWGRGQTKASFKEYMKTHKNHSIASVSMLVSSIVGMYAIGDVELTNQVMATAFLAGFAIDSTINKTPEHN